MSENWYRKNPAKPVEDRTPDEVLADPVLCREWLEDCYIAHMPASVFLNHTKDLLTLVAAFGVDDRPQWRARNLERLTSPYSPLYMPPGTFARAQKILERGERLSAWGRALRALDLDSDPTLRHWLSANARVRLREEDVA
jgi:hypothetical protein